MLLRRYQVESKVDIGTSGTKTYNLDFSEPIESLTLRLDGTNSTTSNKVAPQERLISKIEIVDGGQVLWDCRGDVALSVFAQLAGALPHGYRTEAANDSPYQTIVIPFGRFPYDELYAFNPIAHKNPQLKVTFDEAEINAAGATGLVSDSLTLSLLVTLQSGGPAPIGFLAMREIEAFTSVASGDTKVQLPSDKNIRLMAVRAYEAGIDLRSTISNYRLSIDGGKSEPFDLNTDQMINLMTEVIKPIEVSNLVVFDTADTKETFVGLDLVGGIVSVSSGCMASVDTFWPARATLYHVTHAGAAVSPGNAFMRVLGWCMHNVILYPFGSLDKPEQWLNPDGIRNLDLYLTNGNAGGAVSVALQSVYRY